MEHRICDLSGTTKQIETSNWHHFKALFNVVHVIYEGQTHSCTKRGGHDTILIIYKYYMASHWIVENVTPEKKILYEA